MKGMSLLRYLIAGAALLWVFYGVHPGRLWAELSGINWLWIPAAVGFDILSYICQGIRWKYLLRPMGNLPWLRTTQAIYAGLFTNEILPMRFGELVRAWLVTRWLSADLVSAVPSMAVERLFDGIWLALALGLTSLFVPLPRDLLDAADILGITVISATALFVFLVFRRRKLEIADARRPRWKPLRAAAAFFSRMAEGIAAIGFSRSFFISLFFSLLILVMQALAFWMVMRAYGIDQSIWVGAALLLIVHFGTAIPNAPSNIGSFQFFTVLGLSLFGVDKTTAAGFSVVVFIILTVPLWLIGIVAINRTGLTLNAIRAEITRVIARKPETKEV
jgi:glycosyltransferase 2 family protein